MRNFAPDRLTAIFLSLLLCILEGCGSRSAGDVVFHFEALRNACIHSVYRTAPGRAPELVAAVLVPAGSPLSVAHGGRSGKLASGVDLELNGDGLFVFGAKRSSSKRGGMVFIARDDGGLLSVNLSDDEYGLFQFGSVKSISTTRAWREKIEPQIASCVEDRVKSK